MWNCPSCQQTFLKVNQLHACNEKTVEEFLRGKSAHTLALFNDLVNQFAQTGPISLHTTKTMISIAHNGKKIAYITQLGKNFVHTVLPFKQLYPDNLCFIKSGQVPGSNQFNHHLRMYSKDDLNEEVKKFINMAAKGGY
jgi:hypothetical protein